MAVLLSSLSHNRVSLFPLTLTIHSMNTGIDWLCPAYNEVLVSIVQTGDLHIAVYDLPNEILFVSNAGADSESGPLHAYDRYA